MSTRCNVIVKNGNDRKMFYHHHDGYPSGVGCDLVARCRKNDFKDMEHNLVNVATDGYGTYEECKSIHIDIEFLYIVDVQKKEVLCYSCRTFGFNSEEDIVKDENLEEIPEE